MHIMLCPSVRSYICAMHTLKENANKRKYPEFSEFEQNIYTMIALEMFASFSDCSQSHSDILRSVSIILIKTQERFELFKLKLFHSCAKEKRHNCSVYIYGPFSHLLSIIHRAQISAHRNNTATYADPYL